ncbi:MAG TPA: DUF229 domain-containing protein, partial [Planctomycetaceae bacterium]|nr:DUF229 domain-containing protein [Planctomycetaceae bacterium]
LYDLVTAMDKQVGDILRQLEEDGLADRTIVFFFSDHGTGLPRHKRWIYDSGIRVPLIIRFPERFRELAPASPGSAVDRLVSFVDFAPTMLSLAGVPVPDAMQGRAFLGPAAGRPRRYIFAVRDRVDEVYEVSRAVRDERFLYVRHYLPHRPMMQLSWYSEQTPTRQELRRLAAAGQLSGSAAILMQPGKPLEELYDAQSDPLMIHNLASSPECAEVLQRMRRVHRRWVLETRDTGFLHEAEMHRRAAGSTVWEMARDPARYPLEEILPAADLVGRGPSVRSAMVGRLDHPDPAVRFWAATALVSLGSEARPAADKLASLLDDPSPTVRIAAAEALCAAGEPERALRVLAEGLRDDDPRVRLHAANALQYIGPHARPLLREIEQIVDKPAKGDAALYLRWGLGHVLDQLRAAPGRP